jgi:DNA-nicking Smr family endonuclease
VNKNKRKLSAEEEALWRRVAAAVKTRRSAASREALDEEKSQAHKAPKAEAEAPKLRTSRILPAPPQPPSGPPADRGAERRVRRGKLEPAATLDLHGHTQTSGRAALGRFVKAAFTRGDRVLIVVTGIGRDGAGVLKTRLPEWLAEPDLRGLISGFAQAHRNHGGAGAFYVFLRRAETNHVTR